MGITVELVRAKLATNNQWVERAIVALYERQTSTEKATEATLVHNDRGFNAFDAKSGSYMAKWILSGNHLSGKYLDRARKMVLKYAIQLTAIAIVKEQLSKQESSKEATCQANSQPVSNASSPQSARASATSARSVASQSRRLEPTLPGI